MADYKKVIAKLRHGLAKGTLQSSQFQHSEPLAGNDGADGKEQPGRGPDDKPIYRENQGIIPTPHFS